MITKKLSDFSSANFQFGEVLLIDKDKGDTSFRVVQHVRRLVNVKKVGHAGTLDPAATGLLIVCTGKMTKQISKYQDLGKTYTGVLSLGKTTDSMDAETEFTSEKSIEHVTPERINSLSEKFVGEQFQVPPMYSALRVNGKRLYKYARKGIVIKREPRRIFINSFKINKIALPDVHFEIVCSKGTYIRVIANDFGEELGCGGYLKSLRRTNIGDYSVDDALTIGELKKLSLRKN